VRPSAAGAAVGGIGQCTLALNRAAGREEGRGLGSSLRIGAATAAHPPCAAVNRPNGVRSNDLNGTMVSGLGSNLRNSTAAASAASRPHPQVGLCFADMADADMKQCVEV